MYVPTPPDTARICRSCRPLVGDLALDLGGMFFPHNRMFLTGTWHGWRGLEEVVLSVNTALFALRVQ